MAFQKPARVSIISACFVICDPTGLLQPYTTTTERLRFAYALQSLSEPENHTVAWVSKVPSASTTAASAVLIVVSPLLICLPRSHLASGGWSVTCLSVCVQCSLDAFWKIFREPPANAAGAWCVSADQCEQRSIRCHCANVSASS